MKSLTVHLSHGLNDMLRAKILYILLLVGLAVFYVLYIDSLSLLMLLCALIVPVFLLAGLLWLKLTAECRLTCSTPSCTEGEKTPVTIVLESRCPLFFPRAEADVIVKHVFSEKQELLHLKFPVQPDNNTRLTFYIQPSCCGAVEINMKWMRAYDMFRLFRIRIRSDHDTSTLLVLPQPVPMPLQETAPPVDQPESERFADKPGDDPSEIYGVREYLPGDPVSRIHWKLSSRSDTMLFKEFGSPIEKNILLFAEYHAGASLADAQTVLTLFYSLAYQLIQEARLCELAWYDGKEQRVIFCQPDSEETLGEAFRELYASLFCMDTDADAVRDAFSDRSYSSATVISNHPETLLLSQLEHTIFANQKNLLLVTESESSLQSSLTDIHYIRPDMSSLERLIV